MNILNPKIYSNIQNNTTTDLREGPSGLILSRTLKLES